MRNKSRQVEINGKSYFVNFGLLMLKNFSKVTGLNITQMQEKLIEGDINASLHFAHQSLLAGARAENVKKFNLTLEDVSYLFDDDESAFEVIAKAFQDTLPKSDTEKK